MDIKGIGFIQGVSVPRTSFLSEVFKRSIDMEVIEMSGNLEQEENDSVYWTIEALPTLDNYASQETIVRDNLKPNRPSLSQLHGESEYAPTPVNVSEICRIS